MKMPEELLTRDRFRLLTLAKRNLHCAMPYCSAIAQDAHHIYNRNLYAEASERGGYFLSNGAPLCNSHHLAAERTLLTTDELYEYLGDLNPTRPHFFIPGAHYDTWGNMVLSKGKRLKGPLFNDEGCQKALAAAGVLWQFGMWG